MKKLAFFDTSGEIVDNIIPQDFMVLKYGTLNYTKCGQVGEFNFDEFCADKMITEFADRGKDLVIDYEHQSITGGESPAAGWIKSLEKVQDGLIVKLNYWTDKAINYLKNKEYRYFSPVIEFNDLDQPIALHSVALTNCPALHKLNPLVASDININIVDNSVEVEEKCCCEEKTQEMINNDVKDNTMEQLQKIAELLGITIKDVEQESLVELIINKLAEQIAQLQSAPKAEDMQSMQMELTDLKAKCAVEDAVRANKLQLENVDKALVMAKKDLKMFNDFLEIAPVQKSAPSIKSDDKIVEPIKKISFCDTAKIETYKKMGLSDKQIKDLTNKE